MIRSDFSGKDKNLSLSYRQLQEVPLILCHEGEKAIILIEGLFILVEYLVFSLNCHYFMLKWRCELGMNIFKNVYTNLFPSIDSNFGSML